MKTLLVLFLLALLCTTFAEFHLESDLEEEEFGSCGCGHEHDHVHEGIYEQIHEHFHSHSHSDEEEVPKHSHEDLERRIKFLEDREVVRSTFHTILRRIDDWLDGTDEIDDFCDVFFASEIEYSFGSSGKIQGCENLIKNFYEGDFKDTYKFIRHFVVDSNIFIEGDKAYSRWNGLLAITYKDGQAAWSQVFYDIEWKKEQGMWKITKHRSITSFNTPYEQGWSKMPKYEHK